MLPVTELAKELRCDADSLATLLQKVGCPLGTRRGVLHCDRGIAIAALRRERYLDDVIAPRSRTPAIGFANGGEHEAELDDGDGADDEQDQEDDGEKPARGGKRCR